MPPEEPHFRSEDEPANIGGYEGETEAERERRLHPERAVLEQMVEMLWEKLGPDGVEVLLRVHQYDPANPEQREEDKIYRALYERLIKDKTQQKKKK